MRNFVAQRVDEFDDVEDEDFADASVPAEERDDAHARRGALLVAAEMIIDRCITDLQTVDFSNGGVPDPAQAEDTFVFQRFPRRHRRAAASVVRTATTTSPHSLAGRRIGTACGTAGASDTVSGGKDVGMAGVGVASCCVVAVVSWFVGDG
ncbi:MAG: hypothetical protein M3422_04125 [Actinomycetota bacterium]|nr:hypothetical protein [Actinomycetota bacterium]